MSSTSSSARASRNVINKRGRSISPSSSNLLMTKPNAPDGIADEEIPVTRNVDNIEPIRLSKFSGGYEPDPETPRKIESLDWPAPPYPPAVPELRARSRSTSNRRAASTVQSVNGDYLDSDDEEQEITVDNNSSATPNVRSPPPQQSFVNNTSATSFNSRTKSASYRPNSKIHYRHNFFDNDYDDYLLAYRTDKEWRKTLSKNISGMRYKSGENATSTIENLNENIIEEKKIEQDDELVSPAEKNAQEKLNRELEEIAKLENESSMAADLIKEIKVIKPLYITNKIKYFD